MSEEEAYRLPPLALAYIGDAVWELHVRLRLIEQGERRPQRLHKKAVEMVRANAQADRLFGFLDKCTERERDIVRRGRNAKSGSVPRSAKVADYRASTGFEALIGYLYLAGQTDRLEGVIATLLGSVEE